ncbi:MAG TPA: hypothetical protein VNM66_05105, partial [Thermodesulfobacteriota bacterium]|nr:hypothetical protein [Thermodesulfobacteriota bacterium]
MPARAELVLGTERDFAPPDADSPIALASRGEGKHGWARVTTGHECPGRADGWYPYSPARRLPEEGRGCLRWRAIKPIYVADIWIAPTAPWRTLEIRYKDNLFPPTIDRYWPKPRTTAAVWDGRDWRVVATLETRRDHAWKSVLVPLAAARPTDRGYLAVRLGGGVWARRNEFYGSALVHRLAVTTEPPEAVAVVPPQPGFWPAVPEGRPQRRFGERGFHRPDGTPAFPIAATIPMLDYHPDSFDTIAWAGFNTAVATVSGEGSGWAAWTSRRSPPQKDGQVYLGLPEKLEAYRRRGLDVLVWSMTDTRRAWILAWGATVDPWFLAPPYRRLYDGTAQGVVRVWRQALADYGRHPSVIGWYLKDEFDHDHEGWGSPEETVRQLYALVAREAPHLPTFVGAMAWKPGMLEAASELGDIVVFDHYPAGTPQAPRGKTAQWAEAARRAVAPGQMWVAITALSRAYREKDFKDPARWEPVAESIRFQYYLAVIHGAQMIWTFGDVGPRTRHGAASVAFWTALRDANREIAQLGLSVLHAGSGRTLGRSVAASEPSENPPYPLEASHEGDGVSLHPQVSTLYREGRDGRRVLLALNEWSRPATGVRLAVAGLEAGRCVPVLFEARDACAREPGILVDDFDPYAR